MSRSSKSPASGKQRRALSTTRTPGRIERGGDPTLARALAGALTAAQREGEIAEKLTHPVHTYPARMHPATARALVRLVVDRTGRPDHTPVLLDPFCGSGTTLVEARVAGADAIGVDANPLAVLIAGAKTWSATPAQRTALRDCGHQIARDALAEGKAARRSGYQAPVLRTPPGVDPDKRQARLQRWFAPHVRRELEHMASGIDALRERDARLADVLTVLLSSLLYKVSRRASDTDPRRVERRVGRGQAARLLQQRVDQLADGLGQLADGLDQRTNGLGQRASGSAARCHIHRGDARNLGELAIATGSVDAVISSPPYAGTYDYADQHRLRLDFLGLPTSEFQRAEMGSRRQFAGDGASRRRARRRWSRALAGAMAEMARVVRPGGCAAIVLGDSVAGDRVHWADEVMASAIEKTVFELTAWAAQARPVYGNQERALFGGRTKRECIFLLTRAFQQETPPHTPARPSRP